MTVEVVTDIAREALYLIIKCSAPLLLISLVVGLVVSIFQTATSIQEQTLTFVPKIVCVFLGMMVLGHWILNQIVGFMNELWSNFSLYIR
ncbi:MAG: flagellar biosynthesis protein FliQ [Lachnospiraceae bacterium]